MHTPAALLFTSLLTLTACGGGPAISTCGPGCDVVMAADLDRPLREGLVDGDVAWVVRATSQTAPYGSELVRHCLSTGEEQVLDRGRSLRLLSVTSTAIAWETTEADTARLTLLRLDDLGTRTVSTRPRKEARYYGETRRSPWLVWHEHTADGTRLLVQHVGSEKPTVLEVLPSDDVGAYGADETHLYWAVESTRGVFRRRLDGTAAGEHVGTLAPVLRGRGLRQLSELRVHEGRVYLMEYDATGGDYRRLVSFPVGGGEAREESAWADNHSETLTFVVAGGRFYWDQGPEGSGYVYETSSSSQVVWVRPQGTVPAPLEPTRSWRIRGLDVQPGWLHVTTTAGLLRYPLLPDSSVAGQ